MLSQLLQGGPRKLARPVPALPAPPIQQHPYPVPAPCKALPREAAAAATLARGQGREARRLQAKVPVQAPGATLATAFVARGYWGPELTAWAAPPLRAPRSAANTAPSSRGGPPSPRLATLVGLGHALQPR